MTGAADFKTCTALQQSRQPDVGKTSRRAGGTEESHKMDHVRVVDWSLTNVRRQINGERARGFFRQMVLGKLDIHKQKKKEEESSRHRPFTFKTINSKWITDLSVKCKPKILLESIIGENPGDLGFVNEF